MYYYLVEIDYDNYVLDNTALEEFFAYMGIDSQQFNQDTWATVKSEEFGIVDMPYDTNYILGLMEQMGYDTTDVNAYAMNELLITFDWTDYVLDEFLLRDFFSQLGVSIDDFNQDEWAYVMENELGVIEIPVEVNWVIDGWNYLGLDTSTVSPTAL